MTTVDDIRLRIRQLDVAGTTLRHAVADAEQLADAGDIAGATAALDAVELAAYPALAVGGGGGSAAFSGCSIQCEGGVSVPAAGGADFAFDTSMFDTDSYWDGVSPYLIAPFTGYYHAVVNASFNDFADPTGERIVLMRRENTGFGGGFVTVGGGNGEGEANFGPTPGDTSEPLLTVLFHIDAGLKLTGRVGQQSATDPMSVAGGVQLHYLGA